MRPGMRLSEALATCPALVARRAGPGRRRGGVGARPAPARGGRARGRAGRARLRLLRDAWGRAARGRARGGRFAARSTRSAPSGSRGSGRRHAASPRSRPRASPRPAVSVVVDDGETELFLEPLPLDLLPLSARAASRSSPSSASSGSASSPRLPGAAVADRLGPDGAEAWRLARGEDGARRRGAEAAGRARGVALVPGAGRRTQLTLEQALAALLDRLLARPERAGRAPRQLALSARLVGGGSWRRSLTLREPTAEPDRLRLALAPKLAELPAPRARAPARARGAHRVGRHAGRARPSPREPPARAPARRGCARRARRPGSMPSAPSWRSRRGRASRRAGRFSCRATTERAAPGGRRRPSERRRRRSDGVARRRRPRGVAGGRPLVDGGSRCGAATSTSCSRPARTPSSSSTRSAAGGSRSRPRRLPDVAVDDARRAARRRSRRSIDEIRARS